MNKGQFYFLLDGSSPQGDDEYPRVDLILTSDTVCLLVETPGVSKESLEVSIENKHVVIKGSRKEPDFFSKATHFYKLESFYGIFKRQIPVPADVDVEKAKVEYHNGVLQILIPRSKPNVIEIPID